jgi:hypothetical protein
MPKVGLNVAVGLQMHRHKLIQKSTPVFISSASTVVPLAADQHGAHVRRRQRVGLWRSDRSAGSGSSGDGIGHGPC